jgi:selenocysteine lyase/cysteine desulfurase
MTPSELRALFPSAERCTHLNHAGTSPTSTPVADAVRQVTDELTSDDPFRAYVHHQKRQETLRAAFGRMMNVAPETLAFVRNTSHGIAIAAQAIPFRPGENVVVARTEYPANVYCWMAQAQRGVSVRLVDAREDGLIPEEDLMAACDGSTRVLAVSWVQWGTGQRMDLARLGAFCRERGILLVADVVQGLGALRLDLSALPVDFAAAGCHKWLLAPSGLGVLYVRPELQAGLLPTNIGWNSVSDPIDWERLHYDELKTAASRYEEGSPNLLGTAALNASVGLLERVGFDAVERRVLGLADHARAALRARGMRLMCPEGDGQKSGIVPFRHPRLSNEAVLKALEAEKVVVAVRCGSVRLSPHAYSTEAEIDRAVAAIPE